MSEKVFVLKFFHLTNIYVSYSSYTFVLNLEVSSFQKSLKKQPLGGGEWEKEPLT